MIQKLAMIGLQSIYVKQIKGEDVVALAARKNLFHHDVYEECYFYCYVDGGDKINKTDKSQLICLT